MTVKIITFLGTSVRPTKYSYKDQIYEGSLFQIALRQFVDFDEMLVFVTKDARKIAYPALQELNDSRIKPIDIYTGRTSEGLWNIFSTVIKTVDEGDTVIFDITHGLRSIPFLTFLAAAYLRSAKNVSIEAVLYGAFELGQGGPAPVIDLSEFVSLLDWLTATSEFTKTGNAAALAHQLGRTGEPDLLPLSVSVEEIATGLHLLRPTETSAAAAKLSANLELARLKLPPPFTILSNTILESYGRFGLTGEASARDHLVCQLEMINWYYHRGQLVHALSLAREWVVSLLCQHFGLEATDKICRDEMELLLIGGKIKDPATGEVLRKSTYVEQWSTVPHNKRLRNLWGGTYNLANLRNDVLHSGFRKNPKSAAELKQAVDNALLELNAIAADLGLNYTRSNKIDKDLI